MQLLQQHGFVVEESGCWTGLPAIQIFHLYATFTQQQEYGCQSCIWVLNTLHPHTVQLLQRRDNRILNRTHTCKFSGLTQPHSRHTRCVNGTETGQLVVCHRQISTRESALPHKRVCCVCYVFSCVFSVTYSDGEMSCMSSESFRSSQFSTGAAPISFVFCARFKCSALHPNLKAAVG